MAWHLLFKLVIFTSVALLDSFNLYKVYDVKKTTNKKSFFTLFNATTHHASFKALKLEVQSTPDLVNVNIVNNPGLVN